MRRYGSDRARLEPRSQQAPFAGARIDAQLEYVRGSRLHQVVHARPPLGRLLPAAAGARDGLPPALPGESERLYFAVGKQPGFDDNRLVNEL
jgi:hypothetical protein